MTSNKALGIFVKLIAVLCWGFIVGLAFRPLIDFTYHKVHGALGAGLLSTLAGTLAASVAFGVVLGGPLFIAGLAPLREAYPLFALAFLTGAILFKVAVEGIRSNGA